MCPSWKLSSVEHPSWKVPAVTALTGHPRFGLPHMFLVSSTDMPSPKLLPVGTKPTGSRNNPIGSVRYSPHSLSFISLFWIETGESKRVLYYKKNNSMNIIINHAWLLSLLGTQPGESRPWPEEHMRMESEPHLLS